ncbi:FixH family protein [Candidatus Accumulibacter aalborgensis]|nr:FixH family protein [Candidatus Accumulibacter aalborgensis]
MNTVNPRTLKSYSASQPWYRQPWPWLLMLGPATAIVAGLFTAYLAVVTNDGLVEDDYYKQGLTVNQRTERDHRAAELGIEAEFVLGADGGRIRVLLRSHQGVHLPEALALRIAHPTRPGFDQNVLLHLESAGVYTGSLVPLPPGRWHTTLEDDKQQWRLVGDWVTEKDSTLRGMASAKFVARANGSSDGR